ncbi:MAG TPA: hypothetical protein PK347_18390 [Burkholderiaceae bacterium]|nr:hypothetical protein [Burkholderiaceae bacterium]
MFSLRFQLPVVVTVHARQRMVERDLTDPLLLDIIDTGVDKDAGAGHHWLYKHLADRGDNLLCAAVVLETALVVKTGRIQK